MTVVEERKNGRERYERISKVGELAARFQELGIEVLSRSRWREVGWREILKWINFEYGLTTGSVRTTVKEKDRRVEGTFSKDGAGNVFQFSINGAVSTETLRGVKFVTFGCSFDEKLGQCLLLKGGTISEDPVSVYIHETAKVRIVPEKFSS